MTENKIKILGKELTDKDFLFAVIYSTGTDRDDTPVLTIHSDRKYEQFQKGKDATSDLKGKDWICFQNNQLTAIKAAFENPCSWIVVIE